MPREPKKKSPVEVLAEATLADQARKIEEQQAKEKARQVALDQLHKEEQQNAAKVARFQSVCDHLLGNHRLGVVPDFKRCALHKNHFSDKSVRIYCGKCRFEWKPNTTREHYYVMVGDKLEAKPNPTKKGWRDINEFFYTFQNANELTTRAFRIERIEPELIEQEEEVPA